MKSKIQKTLLSILSVVLIPFLSFAQETPPHTVDAPIDAWLFALLGVGAVYGAIRMNRESGR